MTLIITASFRGLDISNRRHRPITARNFCRYVVLSSNMFENIFCGPTFLGREKFANCYMTHEWFFSPDTVVSADNVSQLLSVICHVRKIHLQNSW